MNEMRILHRGDLERLHTFAVAEIQAGTPGHIIEARLIEEGLDPSSAARLVADLRAELRGTHESEGRRNMKVGAAWCIGGLAVTVLTYASASGGGSYMVAWGAILFGAVQFLQGWSQSQRGD